MADRPAARGPASAGRRAGGVLADRRRTRLRATAALLVVANLLAWLLLRDLPTTALLLLASAIAAPVVHTLLWRR